VVIKKQTTNILYKEEFGGVVVQKNRIITPKTKDGLQKNILHALNEKMFKNKIISFEIYSKTKSMIEKS
jgi:hypothetical protein